MAKEILDAGWVDIIEPVAPVTSTPWLTIIISIIMTIVVCVVIFRWITYSHFLAILKLHYLKTRISDTRQDNVFYKRLASRVLQILQSTSPSHLLLKRLKCGSNDFSDELRCKLNSELNRCLYSTDNLVSADIQKLINLASEYLKHAVSNRGSSTMPDKINT